MRIPITGKGFCVQFTLHWYVVLWSVTDDSMERLWGSNLNYITTALRI